MSSGARLPTATVKYYLKAEVQFQHLTGQSSNTLAFQVSQ